MGLSVAGIQLADLNTYDLQQALQIAPVSVVVQYLREHGGGEQALVIEQAEMAGAFDPALRNLKSGNPAQQIEPLKQLQFARAPRFRAAVLKMATRGPTPQVRCEAIYTFVAMGGAPSLVALGMWIDGTGSDLTPRHQALYLLIAGRLPHALPHLAQVITKPQFQAQLVALIAQRPVSRVA